MGRGARQATWDRKESDTTVRLTFRFMTFMIKEDVSKVWGRNNLFMWAWSDWEFHSTSQIMTLGRMGPLTC